MIILFGLIIIIIRIGLPSGSTVNAQDKSSLYIHKIEVVSDNRTGCVPSLGLVVCCVDILNINLIKNRISTTVTNKNMLPQTLGRVFLYIFYIRTKIIMLESCRVGIETNSFFSLKWIHFNSNLISDLEFAKECFWNPLYKVLYLSV